MGRRLEISRSRDSGLNDGEDGGDCCAGVDMVGSAMGDGDGNGTQSTIDD